MSLINRMLQDLDARQAAPGGRHPLPAEVRPLPPRRPSRRPLVFAGLAVLALVGGLAVVQWGLVAPAVPTPVAVAPVAQAVPVAAIAAVAVPPAPAAQPALPAQPAPTVAAEKPAEPQPVAVPVETKRPASPPSATPSLAAPAEKKSAAAAVKAPDVDSDTRPVRPRPPSTEKPSAASTKAPDAPPPAHGKSVKPPTIERAEAAGSPRERAEADYRKAIVALNQGRLDDAVDGLRKALRDDSMHVGARQLLVRLLLEAKRNDDAAQVLQDGLQGQPAQLGWAMTLARLQVDRGDLAGAWQTLDFSLPAAGHSADYQGFAAHVLQRLGRHREAVVHYLNAARLAPGDGRWWLGLGLALEAEGQIGEAREAFLRAKQSGNLSSALSALVEQKLR
jgi:MSHA biogenesis protein MshN